MSEQTAVQYPVALQDVAISQKFPQYITGRLLPYVASPNLSPVLYTKDPNSASLRSTQSLRAPGMAAKPVHKDAPTRTQYTIRSYSLSDTINYEDTVNDAGIYADEVEVTRNLAQHLALGREDDFISKVSTALTAASLTATPSTKFDASGAKPISYLRGRLDVTANNLGALPNTVVMGYNVATAIIGTDEFKASASYTLPPSQVYAGLENLERIIATLLGIDRVLIAVGSVKNTAAKGAAKSISSLWGDNVLIGHFENQSRDCSSLALSFYLEGDANAIRIPAEFQRGGSGFLVVRKEVPEAMSTLITLHQWRADEVVFPQAGYWVTDTLT